MAPVAILGAGIAGLTAGRAFSQRGIPFTVYEAKSDIAGLATSFTEDGFTYDFGAHFITNRLAHAIGVADRCRVVQYYGESVFVNRHFYSYPFGLLRSPRYLGSALRNYLPGKKPSPDLGLTGRYQADYGRTLANEVAIPLTEAWSGASAAQLAPSVADKIPVSIAQVALLKAAGRLRRKAFAIGYSREQPEGLGVWHVYPQDGLRTLCDRLAAGLNDHIRLNSPVKKILVEDGRVVAIEAGSERHEVSAVISTLPCSVLPRLVVGTNALQPLQSFRFRPMTFVMMRFNQRNILPDTVIWTPETAFPFFRLTETPRSMPWLAPEGKTLITADIGCEVGDDIWKMPDTEIAQMCLTHLDRIAPGARASYNGCRVLRTPIAYPVFLQEYEQHRVRWKSESGVQGLFAAGRNGEFDHLLTEDVYWRTLKRVDEIAKFVTQSPQSQMELV